MKKALILLAATAIAAFTAQNASAKLFDGGVDSENLGKGDWIYYLSAATNRLGGNVSSVTNVTSLMSYYKSQGIDHIVVKAGTGSAHFPSSGNMQFTASLVNAAHAQGLKIFAYTRSHGTDIQGEINLASLCYNRGADGFVIDAEAEWESHNMTGGPTKATQLASGIKNLWPTKFLAHAPFMYISYHSSFPYKEFGRYCDAVMPQCYWYEFGISPSQCATDLNNQWKNWQNSLTGAWTNAIKPIAPIAQGWNSMPASDITTFYNSLNALTSPATQGGYKGISFWRADLHTAAMWTAIKNGVLNPSTGSGGSVIVDNNSTGFSVTGTWNTGTSASDKYGADYRFHNTAAVSEPATWTANLSSGTKTVSAWWSQGSNRSATAPYIVYHAAGSTTVSKNQQINGGSWQTLGTFNFNSGNNQVRLSCWTTTGFVVIADAIRWQ